MRASWRFWVDLLSTRESATVMALFRIATGVVLCWTLAIVVAAGAVEALWVHEDHGGMFVVNESWLVQLLGGATPQVIWGLLSVGLLGGACTALGLGGRVPIFVALHCYQSLSGLSVNASSDLLIRNAMWLLVLAGPGATLSLDCRLRSGRFTSGAQVMAWARYLAIFQMVAVYTFTGLQKIGANWGAGGDYSALYHILLRPQWQRMEMDWIGPLYPLLQVMTFVVVYWEMLAPLLLLYFYLRLHPERGGRLRAVLLRHDLRAVYLAFGAAMHLGIALAMDVGPFSWISLSFYVCFFRPDELHAALQRWRITVRGW